MPYTACSHSLRQTVSRFCNAPMSRHSYTIVSFVLLLLFRTEQPAAAAEIDWAVYEQRGQFEFFVEYTTDVRRWAVELSELTTEIQAALGLPQPKFDIQIIVFRSPDSYRAYLKPRIPEGASRRAIYYREGDVHQIYAYRSPELLTDLRHEFTHAYLHQVLPYVPLWVDEGLAEYFEERSEQRNRSSRLTAMKWRCRTGQTPSLQSLEQLRHAETMTNSHYRDSWAWMYFLLTESRQSRTLLNHYLLAISAGEAPGSLTEFEAGRQVQVTKRMGSYFRRFRFSVR